MGKMDLYIKKFNHQVMNRCNRISNKLNSVKVNNRKMILIIVFLIGLLILLIQTIYAYIKLSNGLQS